MSSASASGAGGKSRSSSAQAFNILPFIRAFERETRPIRQETYSQVLEALRTGGTSAQIPMLQAALSQSRAATTQTLRNTEGDLARQGLAGTPFGASIIAGLELAGRQQAIDATRAIISQIAGLAPGLSSEAMRGILGGLAAEGRSASMSRYGSGSLSVGQQ